jgi:hypothetical protein
MESGLYALFIQARYCVIKSWRGSDKIKAGPDDSGFTVLCNQFALPILPMVKGRLD